MRALFAFLLIFLSGCESEVQKQSAKNFEKIMTDKKRFESSKKEDPSVSEQMTREIHSQSDRSKDKKDFKFK